MKQGMRSWFVVLLAATLVAAAVTAEPEMSGDVRVGWTFTDEEGNEGVYQPNYNLYDGPVVSLEDFSYRMDNGMRIFGDLRNITLNNRNLMAGATRAGLFGITVRHNKYRRTYSFDGDKFTRRASTFGDVWFKPAKFVKLFAGYSNIIKEGDRVDLFEQFGTVDVTAVDYTQNQFHFGTQLNYKRNYLKAEYRQTGFTDDIVQLNDRNARRMRVTAVGQIPQLPFLLFNGGFQNYERTIDLSDDTLSANTVWGGARYFDRSGFSVRYSFIWDRAERTGDVVATDNIRNAIYAGKVWRGVGGVTLGYRYALNDDFFDEESTTGYYVAGWYRPVERLKLEANFGMDETEVDEGRTLVGQESFIRNRFAASYKTDLGTVRGTYSLRKTENEDIGSEATYGKFSVDVYAEKFGYGRFFGSYSFLDGDYTNDGGVFEFRDHVIDADLYTTYFSMFEVGMGGTYYKSQQDLDVESFSLRVSGIYHFMPKHRLEATYSAHNFDNFNDPLPYTEYYTANVVNVSIIHEL